MKKLTLDATWKLCLRQWRWIVKQRKEHPRSHVSILKERWMNEHGFADAEMDCFFCEYAGQQGRSGCSQCPGRKIDKTFDCFNVEYLFYVKPKEFHKKLLELNRERKKRRIK